MARGVADVAPAVPYDGSDADLVLAIRAGDRAAVEVLYDRYAAGLHDFCYSMTRNPHDADDAVQDTFVAAMQKIGSLREPSRLRPWIYAIARHEVFAQSRRRKRTVVTDEMPEGQSDGTVRRDRPDPGRPGGAARPHRRRDARGGIRRARTAAARSRRLPPAPGEGTARRRGGSSGVGGCRACDRLRRYRRRE